jgi:anti-sigma regulatory factor (Ser/Thr protein kinase)
MAMTIEVGVPVGSQGARMARQKLGQLRGRVGRDVLDNLRLLVSELVTNSIRHAGLLPGTWIELKVHSEGGRIRVEVGDPGPGFEPRPVTPNLYQTSGWGLYLVDRISDRWGVIRGATTRVWFELDREPDRSLASAAAIG